MMNLIRIGDDTDRGGNVETGSTTMRFDGRPPCRAQRRSQGDTSMMDSGIPIARHGHRARCGCRLISRLV
ncbi:PAAR domain-containing protein [Burkholderia multivorans]|uniref:PAAR domain-containing protein n=1 Tax=Burkholderia multivorans TaxID=87883 RepID=UPI00143E9EEE|nr:PAAR domain-containing protein [Burkholderia multivorans]QIX16755.1 PAAR domain-containing protein [Burkholderia multivorans]